MRMPELHFHSWKENLELSRREFVTGACSGLEHYPVRVGLECLTWVLTVAVGCLTVGPGLVLPVPCPSLFSCIRLLLNAWYPSASFWFSLATVILDSQGCSSWSEL